ncbi:MAG: hypothetical protein RSP_13560 [Rhodanobacter sp.]
MNIPLEVTGSIVNSNKPSHKVKVSNDSTNACGFLIYEWWDGSDGPNVNFAFDDWVPDEAALQSYFQEVGWRVLWPS